MQAVLAWALNPLARLARGRQVVVSRHEVRSRMLAFITETIESRGYPPSMREIGAKLGLSSPSTVQYHLRKLEAEGKIHRDPSRSRAMVVDGKVPKYHRVPLIASVGAGFSVLADQEQEEVLAVPPFITSGEDNFALAVRGESMIDLGILDGDVVVVRPQSDANDGDVVVANLEDDIGTLKVLRKRGGRVLLEARNSSDSRYAEPVDVTGQVEVVGRVVGLVRSISAVPRV